MGKPGAGANASCSGWDLRFKRRRPPPGRRPHKYLRAGLADLCSEARQGPHSCRSEESVQTLRPEGATGPGRSFGRNTNGVRAARYRGHLVGSSDGQNGVEVLTERAYELSGTASRSSWWLVAKNGDGPLQVLTLDDGDTLPVFSGEGEAELFLWLREAREHGWGVRQSSRGELVSVLCGPCSHASCVTLDPSLESLDGEAAELSGLSRADFLRWMTEGSRRLP